MSDLERDLRHALAQRADSATGDVGDWQDLTIRMNRRQRRSQRLLATGLVLALLAGPIAGFAFARAVEDDSGASNRIIAAGPGDGISTSEGLTWSDVASGAVLTGEMPVDPIFRRTTDDGITIRGFRSDTGANACPEGSWCPPPECIPNASITGQLSTDEAVGLAYGSAYESADNVHLTSGAFGANGEGSPARWVIAAVGDDIARVRVEYAGGGSDEMEPVDGVVVLAARADDVDGPMTVTTFDESGRQKERMSGGGNLSSEPGPVAALRQRQVEARAQVSGTATTTPAGAGAVIFSPAAPPVGECAPRPPSLPAPGEQPADADAARSQVESAFTTAYDGGLGDTPEKRALVEDSESLVAVMEEIRNGTFAQQVKDATARVTEVVFVSPTEAAVRYDILVANYSDFTDRIGRARLIDGVWKVARVTVCQDISLASGSCPE